MCIRPAKYKKDRMKTYDAVQFSKTVAENSLNHAERVRTAAKERTKFT